MENITAAGLDYVYDGKLLDAVRYTLEGTFLGIWVWLIIIVILDAMVFIKTRNAVFTSIINLILMYVFASSLPQTTFMILLTISVMALAGSIYYLFK